MLQRAFLPRRLHYRCRKARCNTPLNSALVCAKIPRRGAPSDSAIQGGFALPRSCGEAPETTRSVPNWLGGSSRQWLNPLLSAMRISVILGNHGLRFEAGLLENRSVEKRISGMRCRTHFRTSARECPRKGFVSRRTLTTRSTPTLDCCVASLSLRSSQSSAG